MNALLANSGYHVANKPPTAMQYINLEKPKGAYRQMLAISIKYGQKSRVMGYVTWRHCDNHKELWLRGPNGTIEHGPKVPQKHKTEISMLARIFRVSPSRIMLRDKTGYTGPVEMPGAPVFRSSSVCGWVDLG